MIQKIKNLMLVAIMPLAIAAPVALVASSPAVYAADNCISTQGGNNNNTISKGIDSGINAATSGNCNTQLTESSDFQTIAAKIVNILSIVVGVVAVIMIIYGGFRYITSGGESGSVSGAKNTLIYAIVGLVIVALAQFIVHFVLDNISA